jgi:C-terminal processing protease CtpA/Prc
MNKLCWSASDVILSSVKGLPNVTLIGEPSVGGSGARIITTLRNSDLDLYLSSMASFQNTGQLFETNGIQPDIHIEPRPEFFLHGGDDRVLRYAIQRIVGTRRVARRVGR